MRTRLATAALTGYLIGTAPSADVTARLATRGAVDLRTAGTGNPGAANAIKVLGSTWGTVVMVADIAKGGLACRTGRAIAGDLGSHVAGTAAVIGHCHPVWTRFKGGKGVAASVGQCLATFPAYFPIDLGIAGLTVAVRSWRRRSTATTVVSCIGWVTASCLWWKRDWPNAWGPRPTKALPIAAAISSAVILGRFIASPPLALADPEPATLLVDDPDQGSAPDTSS